MVAVFKLISVQDPIDLWKEGHKRDFVILVATFIATLSIGIQKGILVGVLLSVLGMLYDTLYPHISLNTSKITIPTDTLIARFEEQLYFANSNYFKDKIEALVDSDFKNNNIDSSVTNITELKHLIIDGSRINKIDSTGQKALNCVITICREKNIDISLVAMPSNIKQSYFESIEMALKKHK